MQAGKIHLHNWSNDPLVATLADWTFERRKINIDRIIVVEAISDLPGYKSLILGENNCVKDVAELEVRFKEPLAPLIAWHYNLTLFKNVASVNFRTLFGKVPFRLPSNAVTPLKVTPTRPFCPNYTNSDVTGPMLSTSRPARIG